MRRMPGIVAVLSCILLVPGRGPRASHHRRNGPGHVGRGAARRTVEAASPALIEKVRTAVTDGVRPVPDREPAARHLHRDVHAARLQHGQARRASS